MEIIHTEKPITTEILRNLKPTEAFYVVETDIEKCTKTLWLVVWHQDENIKVEDEGTWCLSPETGVYRKFKQRTEVYPVDAALVVRE